MIAPRKPTFPEAYFETRSDVQNACADGAVCRQGPAAICRLPYFATGIENISGILRPARISRIQPSSLRR